MLVILSSPSSFEGRDLAKMLVDENLIRDVLHERIQGSLREVDEMAHNLQYYARPTEENESLKAQIEEEGRMIILKMARTGKIITDALAVGIPTLREFEGDQSVLAWEASVREFAVWYKAKLEAVKSLLAN